MFYEQRFFDKVKRIAQTNADGVWIDVPVYFDAVVQWCDINPYALAAFRADTGYSSPPAAEDFSDPVCHIYSAFLCFVINNCFSLGMEEVDFVETRKFVPVFAASRSSWAFCKSQFLYYRGDFFCRLS